MRSIKSLSSFELKLLIYRKLHVNVIFSDINNLNKFLNTYCIFYLNSILYIVYYLIGGVR